MASRKMSLKRWILLIVAFGTSFRLSAQSISANDNYAQEIARVRQVAGKDSSSVSFSLRPMYLSEDSLLNRLTGSKNLAGHTSFFSSGIVFRIFPVNLLSEYNVNRPY